MEGNNRGGVSATRIMPEGQSGAWSTAGCFVAGHPENSGPFMTIGMRFYTFKLAYPGIIISPDNRAAVWRDANNTEWRKECDKPGELIAFLERTFGHYDGP